jgi:hypothetical protein
LLWPAALNRSALIFPDTRSYLNHGAAIVERAGNRLDELIAAVTAPDVAGAGEAAAPRPGGSSRPIRSLFYSTFAYVSAVALPATGFLTVWLQALLVTLLIALLLDRSVLERPRALAVAAIGMAAFTALPFYVSFLMPDILGAVVLLWALLLVRGVERLTRGEWLFVLAATTFALVSHYGFLGLAAGVGGFALVLLALRARLSVSAVLLTAAPILLAIGLSMAASVLVFKEPSVTPKRFPILLARSLVDGPARWYLKDVCPAAGYEMCRDIDSLPDTLQAVLWDEGGIVESRSFEQLDRIRREEAEILIGALRAYPLEQGWSLARNSVAQLGAIGLADHVWAPLLRNADGIWEGVSDAGNRAGLDAIGTVQTLVVAAAGAYLGALLFRRRLDAARREPDMLLVLLMGLLINAVVFGGLSAPADRYQGRLAWLVPMLAAIMWLARRPASAGKVAP